MEEDGDQEEGEEEQEDEDDKGSKQNLDDDMESGEAEPEEQSPGGNDQANSSPQNQITMQQSEGTGNDVIGITA